MMISSVLFLWGEKGAVEGSVQEHMGPGQGRGQTEKVSRGRGNHWPIYFRDSFPLGPVIQVLGAHCL